jgi:hypothetical protein
MQLIIVFFTAYTISTYVLNHQDPSPLPFSGAKSESARCPPIFSSGDFSFFWLPSTSDSVVSKNSYITVMRFKKIEKEIWM